MIKRLPKFTRNFYFLFSFFFLIWMLFFDSNDLWNQWKLMSNKSRLQREKEYYVKNIKEVNAERQELLTNPELLEKFARERYLMKKPGEDIYVIYDKKFDK